MTKAQAIAEFREFILPSIRKSESQYGNGTDETMRREEWNNYTDSLCKDGRITSHQYNTWTGPF